MNKKKIFLLISLLLLILAVGCSMEKKDKSDKMIIAVTIIPQKAFVEKVCGDLAEVISLVPPGSSPESYEPTPKEIQKFNDASIYFSIGVQTEQSNILPLLKGIKNVKLHEYVSNEYPDLKFSDKSRDPHIWLSPKRVKVMTQVIADELSQLDPDNKAIYQKNAEEYIKELDTLDKDIKTILNDVTNKKFIAFHPAFGYFASDYDLIMYSLEEEGKEATPKHLEDMIDLAKQENIKVIFYQSEIDSSQSKAFAEEIKGRTVMLSPLAYEYIDNLRTMASTISEGMQ